MARQRQALMVTMAVTSLALVAGCGSSQQGQAGAGGSSSTTSNSTTSSPTVSSPGSYGKGGTTASAATITIKDFAFSGPASVSPGATVTVVNQDSQKHTLTAKDGKAFDVTIDGGGGKATFTAPSAPGSYAYICRFHGNMSDTLVVK